MNEEYNNYTREELIEEIISLKSRVSWSDEKRAKQSKVMTEYYKNNPNTVAKISKSVQEYHKNNRTHVWITPKGDFDSLRDAYKALKGHMGMQLIYTLCSNPDKRVNVKNKYLKHLASKVNSPYANKTPKELGFDFIEHE